MNSERISGQFYTNFGNFNLIGLGQRIPPHKISAEYYTELVVDLALVKKEMVDMGKKMVKMIGMDGITTCMQLT